jgi:hypothetical protein
VLGLLELHSFCLEVGEKAKYGRNEVLGDLLSSDFLSPLFLLPGSALIEAALL